MLKKSDVQWAETVSTAWACIESLSCMQAEAVIDVGNQCKGLNEMYGNVGTETVRNGLTAVKVKAVSGV